jgi:capsular exopolysaccharide synthesis family protein
LLGLLAGIGLGIGLVLLRDYLDDTFHGAEEIERYLHVDVLASVPRYTSELEYPVVEAYQSLRTALLFAQQGEGGQVVLITGTAPQEGKTTTLLNLAGLLAASGERTLVVDCDLRRAQIHHRLGLAREPGLSEVFLHHTEVETLVRPTRTPNLFALTAGQLPPNPPAVLGRRDVAPFFDRLRKSFDWILVDSPPLASVTDGLLLARHADVVLLVVQFNHVDKRLVKRSLAALRKASENFLGVVMNAVDMKSERYGGYYYYYASRAESAKRQSDSEPTSPPDPSAPDPDPK